MSSSVSTTRVSGGLASLPTFTTGTGGAVRVTHREYLGDLVGSINFSADVWSINPGNADTFPWLSSVALQFEEFRFNGRAGKPGLRFEFVTTSGDALTSVNTALGTVMMCTQYNSTNPPFVDKFRMENYSGCVSGKPSRNLWHSVNTLRSQTPMTPMYVRSISEQISGLNGQGNILQYDLGQFYLASVGMQADGNRIGELWVSYDVTLLKPRLNPYRSLLVPALDFWVSDVATYNVAYPLGFNPITRINTVGCDFINHPSGGRPGLQFPAADPPGTTYRVTTVWSVAAGGAADATGWLKYDTIGFNLTTPTVMVLNDIPAVNLYQGPVTVAGSTYASVVCEAFFVRRDITTTPCMWWTSTSTFNISAAPGFCCAFVQYFNPRLGGVPYTALNSYRQFDQATIKPGV